MDEFKEDDMTAAAPPASRKVGKESSRVPENSVFYAKVVPALLIALAIVTVLLILVAAGVLLGIVPYT